MMRIVTIVPGALLLCVSVAWAQTSPTTPAACEALRQLTVEGVALTVTKTEWIASGARLPAGRGGGPPVGRSRPLRAYPLHAQYKGQGNTEDSSSFECRP